MKLIKNKGEHHEDLWAMLHLTLRYYVKINNTVIKVRFLIFRIYKCEQICIKNQNGYRNNLKLNNLKVIQMFY